MPDEPVQRMFSTVPPAAEGGPVAGPPTPERIVDISGGFMVSKFLFVAAEVGLFAAVDADGATAGTIAERCGLPVRSARAVADLLASSGLLERDGDRYRNAADAEAFLAGRGPFDLRPLLRYWDLVSYPAWANAATAVRTRQGVRPPLDEAQTEAYESAVSLVTAATAADLAGAYDFGRHRRVLDVGGGTGTFLTPILAAHEHLTATLLDLPEVAELARERLAGGPLSGRLEPLGADVFTDPLPEGHDAIIVADFLHLFGPQRNAELLARLREVIAPGGRLLLVDWWRDPVETHPSARFGAGEFLMISGGDTYEAAEVAQWLGETGWRLVAQQPLPPPAGLIVAEPAT
jgi:hypothetical protein